jgi:hypothetical protein
LATVGQMTDRLGEGGITRLHLVARATS